jgi:hypothetical protein
MASQTHATALKWGDQVKQHLTTISNQELKKYAVNIKMSNLPLLQQFRNVL